MRFHFDSVTYLNYPLVNIYFLTVRNIKPKLKPNLFNWIGPQEDDDKGRDDVDTPKKFATAHSVSDDDDSDIEKGRILSKAGDFSLLVDLISVK